MERGAGGIRPPRALLLLGASSYALYLTHHLVLGAAYRLIGGWGLGTYLVATGLSVLGGFVSWRVLEVPLTRAVRRAVHRPAPFAPALSRTSAGPGPARR